MRRATPQEIRRALQRHRPVGGEFYVPEPHLADPHIRNNWSRIVKRQTDAILRSLK